MSTYKEILEKVQSYLQDDNNPEVKSGEITLYELYNIIGETINELYRKQELEGLLKKVNEENSTKIIKKVGRLFKKNQITTLLSDRYQDIYFSYDEKEVALVFSSGGLMGEYFTISKDCESNELYTDIRDLDEYQKKIMENHYDEILELLTSLQEYREVTGIKNYFSSEEKKQKINDGFMDANLTYTYYGRLSLNLGIDKANDPDRVAQRDYYRQDRIQDIIEDNKATIAKKIVVDENELSPDYKRILNRSKMKSSNKKTER